MTTIRTNAQIHAMRMLSMAVVLSLCTPALAEEPEELFEGAAHYLRRWEQEQEIRVQAAELARDGDPERARLEKLHRSLRARVI